jgi:hypothetical protein
MLATLEDLERHAPTSLGAAGTLDAHLRVLAQMFAGRPGSLIPWIVMIEPAQSARVGVVTYTGPFHKVTTACTFPLQQKLSEVLTGKVSVSGLHTTLEGAVPW